MEIKKFKTVCGIDEGVDLNKFLPSILIADEDIVLRIKSLFNHYGYELDVVPGEFIKIFTMNEKEIPELESVLERIEEMGLKSIFQQNLRVCYFKAEFIQLLQDKIRNNEPYLNQDNTFLVQAAGDFQKNISNSENKKIEGLDSKSQDAYLNMTDEDRTVYLDVLKTLIQVGTVNSDDAQMVEVISKLKDEIIEPIANKMYIEKGVKGMMESIIDDSFGFLKLVDRIRVKDSIVGAFSEDRKERNAKL